MHIPLIQELAFQSRGNLSYHGRISSMFQLLHLSAHDCNLEFEMTKSFKKIISNFPKISSQVQNDLNNIFREIINYAILNLYIYDPIMEDLVKTVVQSIEEHNTSCDTTITATTTSNPSIAPISNQQMYGEYTQLHLTSSFYKITKTIMYY
jgi:hypothetical protein